ncbi:MAG: lipopolysaccharide heptosyltransferase I [Gammaproteobacteria bacterium AqS3]|nr:lipopolysaccharide heptosyltransferase I [Gammaproteobacteria bacterium AqS3]
MSRTWLLVKTSSLGDVVHASYAVSDLADAGIEVDWVLEQDYAPLVRSCRGVRRALGVDWRRALRRPLSGAPGRALAELSAELQPPYECVLDAQGLLKSAWLTLHLAGRSGAPSVGMDAASARERLAGLLYQSGIAAPRGEHAVVRLRRLFAAARGEAAPDTEPVSGLHRKSTPTASDGRIWLLHGASRTEKTLGAGRWRQLALKLYGMGLDTAVSWGSPAERQVAQALPEHVEVIPKCSLDALAERLKSARGFVGVDSGLAHLAAALGVPGVTLYPASDAQLTGTLGAGQRRIDAHTINRLGSAELGDLIGRSLMQVLPG